MATFSVTLNESMMHMQTMLNRFNEAHRTGDTTAMNRATNALAAAAEDVCFDWTEELDR